MKRASPAAVLGAVLSAAVLVVAASLAAVRAFPDPPALASFEPHSSPAAAGEDQVLVRLFRGRTHASQEEVEITTIFHEPGFSVVADTATTGSDQGIQDHVKEVFSLREIASLGSSHIPLRGGSVIVDEAEHREEIRLSGQPVGRHAVRLVVSEAHDGREIVATSVIARRGRTVVLAGHGARADDTDVTFICLTPL